MKTKNTNESINPAGPYSPWWPGMKPPKEPNNYVIEVLGCISEDWSGWFNGLQIQFDESKGKSYIHGKIKDQAELFSVLIKIRNLGLSILRLSGNV